MREDSTGIMGDRKSKITDGTGYLEKKKRKDER
jgi:hypothetical protein